MRPRFPVPRLPEDLPALLRPRLRHGRHDVQQRVLPGDRELPQQESRDEKVSRRVRAADRGAEELSVLDLARRNAKRRHVNENRPRHHFIRDF